VPSRRLQFESELDALEAYRRLRSLNPSPYMFYIDFSSFQLIGASPESVVRVENGFATIRPIAGTKKRGKNRDEDEMHKELLENDPKEKAEHLMLVDLARGDLSRVCIPGTVELSSFQKPEFYSHVIHLVSEVRGKLNKNIHSTDVFRATFPAGTVSGSPKKKVMELISKLESSKRNFYAGAVGYMQSSGDLDFCIAIRSALKQGKIWTMQAGGGIVFASDEEREWEETNEKLSAFSHIFEMKDIK
jgi:anthranilate synthase component 1